MKRRIDRRVASSRTRQKQPTEAVAGGKVETKVTHTMCTPIRPGAARWEPVGGTPEQPKQQWRGVPRGDAGSHGEMRRVASSRTPPITLHNRQCVVTNGWGIGGVL